MRPLDNQDKAAWCEAYGTDTELAFVKRLFLAGVAVSMSPLKVADKYGHDLLLTVPADLKSVRTPFFTARSYGLDPQYAVTLNHKDVERYTASYPLCVILFDVRWDILDMLIGGERLVVTPMEGVWVASMDVVRRAIVAGKAKTVEYAERRGDRDGNAKQSYLLDLRWFQGI